MPMKHDDNSSTSLFFGTGDLEKGPNGAAAIGRINNIPHWLLDAGTTEDIVGSTGEPARLDWSTMDVSVICAPSDGSASAGVDDEVVWNLQYAQAAVDATLSRSGDVTVTRALPSTAGQLTKHSLATGVSVTADGYFDFDLLRSGGAAGDNYTADVGVLGILLEKAS